MKNVAQVALEAGNSPAVIFSNYRELVTPQDAKEWFAIVPKGKRGGGSGQQRTVISVELHCEVAHDLGNGVHGELPTALARQGPRDFGPRSDMITAQ